MNIIMNMEMSDRYRKCVRMIEFAVEERACREEGWRSQPASSGRVSVWRSWWCLNSLYRKDQVQHLFVSFIALTLLIIVYLTTHAHKKRNIDKQRWNKRLDYDIVLMRTLYNEYFTLITVFVTIDTTNYCITCGKTITSFSYIKKNIAAQSCIWCINVLK